MRASIRRAVIAMLSLALVYALGIPGLAFATETQVEAENYAAASGQATVSGIEIDGVASPHAGEPLDTTAQVRTAENASWEIPVLWLSEDLQLASEGTIADSDTNYLPVLAFYVPEGHSLESSTFTVTLSSSLTELFQGSPIISIYESSTGITYILPASVKNYFVRTSEAAQASAPAEPSAATSEPSTTPSESSEPEPDPAPSPDPAPQPDPKPQPEPKPQPKPEDPEKPQPPSLIDIYCAQTARDAFSDSDLEYLIDLVLNRLQPQAIELLLDKFPAFRTGADQGKIGSRIGLYIYYETGDADGEPAHQSLPDGALAFVRSEVISEDDRTKFVYFIGVDVSSLTKKDANDNATLNNQGKYIIVRAGEDMEIFQNTIVHEMLHAIMYDFNRTGMIGATRAEDVLSDENGQFRSKELEERYKKTYFPLWFIEGTASAVENVFQYRYDSFVKLFEKNEQTTAKGQLLYNYLNAKNGSREMLFDLGFSSGVDASGEEVSSTNARYVSGYLACLYLGELAARSDSSIGTSIAVKNGKTTISSEKIRLGLNAIFEQLHQGATLDQIVRKISPTAAGGGKLYASVDEFEQKFVKGAGRTDDAGDTWYDGDFEKGASAEFVATFLRYMFDLEKASGGKMTPNGSVLFAFDRNYNTPLDAGKKVTSDHLKIIESNAYVESSVPNPVALAGGGKSRSGTPTIMSTGASSSASGTNQMPAAAAAKAANETNGRAGQEADEGDPSSATPPLDGDGDAGDSSSPSAPQNDNGGAAPQDGSRGAAPQDDNDASASLDELSVSLDELSASPDEPPAIPNNLPVILSEAKDLPEQEAGAGDPSSAAPPQDDNGGAAPQDGIGGTTPQDDNGGATLTNSSGGAAPLDGIGGAAPTNGNGDADPSEA